ncbi:MAG TPA: VIT1/CCC1 transporter family protein [Thermomicrobiaceae bacterium]|nr:VIT1/CCC1 transporter family protein [Thermomicrobiaceae bacterium]
MATRTERDQRLVDALTESWKTEHQSAATYRLLAEREPDERRRALLLKLAEAESRHAERWAGRLRELGSELPATIPTVPATVRLRSRADLDTTLRRIEATEEEHLRHYETDIAALGDAETAAIAHEVAQEEGQHARTLRAMTGGTNTEQVRSRLTAIMKGERHVTSGNWIADAIYGANDGLGAIFGLVAGVAGANVGSRYILVAGVAGAVAAAVSMGSGAFLAARSEREVHEAEVARERREIEEDPAEEKEELSLFYQLKGFSEDEANRMAERMSQDESRFLGALASEELGLSEERLPNPTTSMLSAMISTGVGAIVPVLPFFFMTGWTAVIVAAVISLAGHFAVGAAKSLVTIRSWWASGLEMTLIGVVVGVVTYGVGFLIGGVAG